MKIQYIDNTVSQRSLMYFTVWQIFLQKNKYILLSYRMSRLLGLILTQRIDASTYGSC